VVNELHARQVLNVGHLVVAHGNGEEVEAKAGAKVDGFILEVVLKHDNIDEQIVTSNGSTGTD